MRISRAISAIDESPWVKDIPSVLGTNLRKSMKKIKNMSNKKM